MGRQHLTLKTHPRVSATTSRSHSPHQQCLLSLSLSLSLRLLLPIFHARCRRLPRVQCLHPLHVVHKCGFAHDSTSCVPLGIIYWPPSSPTVTYKTCSSCNDPTSGKAPLVGSSSRCLTSDQELALPFCSFIGRIDCSLILHVQ